MSSPPLTIEADRPLVEAAETMLDNAVERLPVLDASGGLVGLVSRTALVRAFVRAFVRPDEAIRREIEESVLRGTLWVDHPDDIRVEVAAAEVTLSGRVDSDADAAIVPVTVRRVPGVVGVTARLAVRGGRARAR